MGDVTRLVLFSGLLVVGLAAAARARIRERPVGPWLVGIVIAVLGAAEALRELAG